MSTMTWWRIAQDGGQPEYGFGSRSEADEYADNLDVQRRDDDICAYHVRALTADEIEADRQNLEAGGFDLEEELAALRAA